MINFSIISFDQTIEVSTRSRFSDFVDFVRISKICQDNHHIKYLSIYSSSNIHNSKWLKTNQLKT